MRPGPEVLASFGASADPVSLPDGRGTAWRAGEVVLKPADDPWVARWTSDLSPDVNPLEPVDPLNPLDPLAARRDASADRGDASADRGDASAARGDASAARRNPGFRVPRPLSTVAEGAATGDWVAQDPLA